MFYSRAGIKQKITPKARQKIHIHTQHPSQNNMKHFQLRIYHSQSENNRHPQINIPRYKVVTFRQQSRNK